MSKVIETDSLDELRSIIDSNDEVVVDFMAMAWCVPCQRFAPHFEKAADKSDATFVAVDVDKVPAVVAEYGVQGVPTVQHFRNGDYVQHLRGRTVVQLLSELGE